MNFRGDMMNKLGLLFLLSTVLFLAACSQDDEPEVKKVETATATKTKHVKKPTMSKDNVFKGYKDDLDKAKAMEDEVLKAAEKRRKAIDDI